MRIPRSKVHLNYDKLAERDKNFIVRGSSGGLHYLLLARCEGSLKHKYNVMQSRGRKKFYQNEKRSLPNLSDIKYVGRLPDVKRINSNSQRGEIKIMRRKIFFYVYQWRCVVKINDRAL